LEISNPFLNKKTVHKLIFKKKSIFVFINKQVNKPI
jgi:hypothetical protein